jgi:carbon-monoxide dehydrogenase small subunit
MAPTISFQLNGKPVRVTADGERMLLWVLRSDLGLTGTKFGCGEGACGACTVIVDGEAVRSCVTPLRDVAGKEVLTIEGLGERRLHTIQEAFLKHHAFQCGFCTPGMVLTSIDLLRRDPHPDANTVREALSGNLCRCTGYEGIVAAVLDAATTMNAKSDKTKP